MTYPAHTDPTRRAQFFGYDTPQDPGHPAPDPDDAWEHRTPEHEAREMKAQFAEREAEQENAAFAAKQTRWQQEARSAVPAEFQDKSAGASNKQLNFLASLAQEKELSDEHRDELTARIAAQVNANEEQGDRAPGVEGGISKNRASSFIGRLLEKPKRKATAEASPKVKTYDSVPDGHYALEFPDDELNPIRFYVVDTGTRGRWEGFQFLSRFASDETYPVKGQARDEVMERLAADPKAAAVLYGHESGRCCLCHRKLTREESRTAGIGPVCAGKAGW